MNQNKISSKLSVTTTTAIFFGAVFILFGILLSELMGKLIVSSSTSTFKDSVGGLLARRVSEELQAPGTDYPEIEVFSQRDVLNNIINSIKTEDLLHVKIWDRNGNLVSEQGVKEAVSSEFLKRGNPFGREEYNKSLSGYVGTLVNTSQEPGFIAVYVPLYSAGLEQPLGVSETFYDLTNTSEQISSSKRTVQLVAYATLVPLYLVLIFISRVQSRKLEASQVRLALKAQELEKKVNERTFELNQKVEELESANKLMTGREIKMMELKKEIERLK